MMMHAYFEIIVPIDQYFGVSFYLGPDCPSACISMLEAHSHRLCHRLGIRIPDLLYKLCFKFSLYIFYLLYIYILDVYIYSLYRDPYGLQTCSLEHGGASLGEANISSC